MPQCIFLLSLTHHWKKHLSSYSKYSVWTVAELLFHLLFQPSSDKDSVNHIRTIKSIKTALVLVMSVTSLLKWFPVLYLDRGVTLSWKLPHCKQNPITILIFDVFFSFRKGKFSPCFNRVIEDCVSIACSIQRISGLFLRAVFRHHAFINCGRGLYVRLLNPRWLHGY